MEKKFNPELVAPCGMNCGLCKSYLAYSRNVPYQKGEVTHCKGCIARNKNCAFIKRDCPNKLGRELRFCYECKDMPCTHLIKLNELYTRRYGTSLVANLKEIQENGISEFLKNQEKTHQCPKCADIVSIHDGKCYTCGYRGLTPMKKVGKTAWDKAR